MKARSAFNVNADLFCRIIAPLVHRNLIRIEPCRMGTIDRVWKKRQRLKFYEIPQKYLQSGYEMIMIRIVISTNHIRVLTNPLATKSLYSKEAVFS